MIEENKQQRFIDEHPVTIVIAKGIGSIIGSFINFVICMQVYNWLVSVL